MAALTNPQFRSPRKHTVDHLDSLPRLNLDNTDDVSVLLGVAELTVQHGLPVARTILRKIQRQAGLTPSAQRFLISLTLQLNAVDQLCSPLPYLEDRELLESVYDPDGYILVEKQGSRRLLVVFATVFNNFYFSNLVLLELLQRFNSSILLLKDDSPMSCLFGVKGMGDSFDSVADSIADLVERRSYSEVFITGYSSGGFPALLLSCMIPFKRLLVFSPKTDFSGTVQSELVPELNRLIFQNIPREQLPQLRQRLENSRYSGSRTVVYGLRSEFDREHAAHIANTPGLTLCAMPNAGHNTVAQLMASGSLIPCFGSLFTGQPLPVLGKHGDAAHA
jgi:hypothetical protein